MSLFFSDFTSDPFFRDPFLRDPFQLLLGGGGSDQQQQQGGQMQQQQGGQLATRDPAWEAFKRGPRVDLVEKEDGYEVKADLPGLKKVGFGDGFCGFRVSVRNIISAYTYSPPSPSTGRSQHPRR